VCVLCLGWHRSNIHCCTADRAWRCVQADLLRKLSPLVSAVFIGWMYRFSVRYCKWAWIRNTFHSCNTVDKPSVTKCRNLLWNTTKHNEISWRVWSDVPGRVYLAEVIILTRSVCLLAWNPFLKNICINPLKPGGNTSLTFNNSTPCPHSVFTCFLCGSENKQRLFPDTALTNWFL